MTQHTNYIHEWVELPVLRRPVSRLLEFRRDHVHILTLGLGQEEVQVQPHSPTREHKDQSTIWTKIFLKKRGK